MRGPCAIIIHGPDTNTEADRRLFCCLPASPRCCRLGCNPTQGCIFVFLAPQHNCAADMSRRRSWGFQWRPGEKPATRIARVRDWFVSPRLSAPCSLAMSPEPLYPQHHVASTPTYAPHAPLYAEAQIASCWRDLAYTTDMNGGTPPEDGNPAGPHATTPRRDPFPQT